MLLESRSLDCICNLDCEFFYESSDLWKCHKDDMHLVESFFVLRRHKFVHLSSGGYSYWLLGNWEICGILQKTSLGVVIALNSSNQNLPSSETKNRKKIKEKKNAAFEFLDERNMKSVDE